jgi:hypothetical protein
MPIPAKRLRREKEAFLRKFNLKPKQQGWKETALRDAVASSSRRAHLYRPGTTQAERDLVREGWFQELTRLSDLYATYGIAFSTQVRFDADLLTLRSLMNSTFDEYFETDVVKGYPPGFRIAHAQKSLSVMLKHLWCNDGMEEPPCCPVDRRILMIAGAKGTTAKWTDLDNLDSYHEKLERLHTASLRFPIQPISLAQWELLTFN